MTIRLHNFNAGPSALPLSVLERAQGELVNFSNKGLSVMEMSHRDKMFVEVLERAEKGLRENMGIPDDYGVLFLGGGASLQFSMVPMNLAKKGAPVDIIHTGAWTKKAIDDAKLLAEVRLAASGEVSKFLRLPAFNNITIGADASYAHICSNNTIEGTQWAAFPETGEVPLVADMSSDILSRPIDVKRFGLIFAGAQKNLGPAGVTIVIIRKDLVERSPKTVPAMLNYKTLLKEPSLYNTPPCYPIYMLALVMEWIKTEGGVVSVEKKNREKAALLYKEIDADGFYSCPVASADRSPMNVVFRIKGGDEALEEKFVAESKAAGMIGLKGHRSVGGLRASIYNAVPLASVQALVAFMAAFRSKNK